MLKRKPGETYAQHRARTIGTTRLGAAVAVLALSFLVAVLWSYAASIPPDAGQVGRQHFRDAIGAAKFQYFAKELNGPWKAWEFPGGEKP